MTSLTRTVRCSNCSTDATLSVNSDMDLKELTFAGRCSRCGATVQINFNIIGGAQANQSSDQASSSATQAQQGEMNLDESIFGQAATSTDSATEPAPQSDAENLSDALKDLMEA